MSSNVNEWEPLAQGVDRPLAVRFAAAPHNPPHAQGRTSIKTTNTIFRLLPTIYEVHNEYVSACQRYRIESGAAVSGYRGSGIPG